MSRASAKTFDKSVGDKCPAIGTAINAGHFVFEWMIPDQSALNQSSTSAQAALRADEYTELNHAAIRMAAQP